jgi:hypothetical protein
MVFQKWPARPLGRAGHRCDKDCRLAMQQIEQPNPQNYPSNPMCVKCGARMWLMGAEEHYPGYTRRLFECPVCGETMTQWADASLARTKNETDG